MKRSLLTATFVAMVLLCTAATAAASDNPNLNPMLPESGGEGVIDAINEDGSFIINDTVVWFSPNAKLRTMDDRALFTNELAAGDRVLFHLNADMQIIWLMKLE